MALTWKLFGITVTIRREDVEATLSLPRKLKARPPSPEQRREIEKEYTLASGNRHVGPTL